MTKNEKEEDKWRRAGKEGAKSEASTRRLKAPYFAHLPNSPLVSGCAPPRPTQMPNLPMADGLIDCACTGKQ